MGQEGKVNVADGCFTERAMPSILKTRVCYFNVPRPLCKTVKSETVSWVDLVDSLTRDTKGLRRYREVNLI